eukprot:jgi/Chrpa1/23916/Chrysochromulina_OHIO_Genome00012518-RA
MPNGLKRKRARGGASEFANETASGSAFEWLLSTAISPASFFADHWEREPLLAQLSKTAGDRYDTLTAGPAGSICSSGVRQPLFGTAVLLDIARSHGPLELGRQLQVMRVGDDGRREQAEPPRDGFASAPWLEARLEEGFTVQLFQPQHWVDRLWALLAAMEAELGCLCGCSVYHTPAGCQGLAPHHDDVEVFILQTEGRKRWKLYPPLDGHALPSRPSPDLADEIIGECMLDVVLCPGDLLYMPRGVIHQAVSLEDASSTHLTLSTYQRHAWADLVGHMLPRLLERASSISLDLRRGLPVQCLQAAGSAARLAGRGVSGSTAAFEAAAGAALQQVLEAASSPEVLAELVHEAADEIGADFMQNRLPPLKVAKGEWAGARGAAYDGGTRLSVGPPPAAAAAGGYELELRLCAPSVRRMVVGSDPEGTAYVQLQHCVGNERRAHMTRAKGMAREEEEDEEDEEDDEEEDEDEDEDEDGDGDEDDVEDGEGSEAIWRHLVFPRSMLATLLQLDEAYPRWLPLSELRQPKRRALPHLQAMLAGCWADGVLHSRPRAAVPVAATGAELDVVEQVDLADLAELRAKPIAKTTGSAAKGARATGTGKKKASRVKAAREA